MRSVVDPGSNHEGSTRHAAPFPARVSRKPTVPLQLGPTGKRPSASNQKPINSRAGRGEVALLTESPASASSPRTTPTGHRSTTHLFFSFSLHLANRRPSTLPTQAPGPGAKSRTSSTGGVLCDGEDAKRTGSRRHVARRARRQGTPAPPDPSALAALGRLLVAVRAAGRPISAQFASTECLV